MKSTHHRDLLRRKLERHRPQVVAEPLLLARRGDGDDILIYAPPQADLARADCVLLGQGVEYVISWAASALRDCCERAVGRCCDALVSSVLRHDLSGSVETYLLLVVRNQISVLQVRMELDLVDRRRDRSSLENPVQVLGQVVRDPNRLRQALSLELLHLLPLRLMLIFLLSEERRVNQIPTVKIVSTSPTLTRTTSSGPSQQYSQIHMINPQLLQTRLQRPRNISNLRQHLSNHIKLLPRHPTLLDSGTQLRFGFVDFRAVKVVIPESYGGFGAVDAGLVELGFVAGFVPGGACAVGELCILSVSRQILLE